MDYKVIITKNGEYTRTLHKCKSRDTSFLNFNLITKANESIYFPRQFINSHGIKPVEYQIYIVKDIEEGDEYRTLRDKMGRVYKEKPLFGKWTVLSSAEYNVEETFWLYGYSPVNERKSIIDIIKVLMVGSYKQNYNKQVIVVHNKLVFHNEEEFNMVICKNKLDAQRLHHALAKACKTNQLKNLLFMGTAGPASVSMMYDIILDNTDWSIEKIRRTSTRP